MTQPDVEKNLSELLREEYEQIQSKIDKIGEFKFIVKGWALTILSGFGLGVFTYSEIPWYAVLALLPVIGIFHFLEREQDLYQTRLERRISQIEIFLRRSHSPKEENPRKKEILDDKALKDIGYSPRYGSIMGVGGKDRKSFFLDLTKKENALYCVIYFLTIGLTSLAALLPSKNNANEPQSPVEINYHSIEKSLNNEAMKSESKIDNVEEELYSLVSQIEYGDIADIDLYWESLANSLLKLKMVDAKTAKSFGGSPKVSQILNSMDFRSKKELVSTTMQMEKLSKKASNSSDENTTELQELAVGFEEQFQQLITQLRKNGR
jgi:hypothetical protein